MRGWGKRLKILLAAVLFLQGLFLSVALAQEGYMDLQMKRTVLAGDAERNNNRMIDVPGRGPMLFYAQNNPFWAGMRYETRGSRTFRQFGEGGCNPTSAAIAIGNLIPLEELGKIRRSVSRYANGHGIASNAMNPLNLQRRVGVWWFEYAEEYRSYLPLIFGQFAAGNNGKGKNWRIAAGQESGGGTSAGFLPELSEIYGLNFTKYPGRMNLDWMNAVKCGATAIGLANSQWHPFANSNGHYVVLVGCDEEYVYILDPQDKAAGEYKNDRRNVLEVMEPGLVRVKLSDFRYLQLGMVFVFTTEEIEMRMAERMPTLSPEAPEPPAVDGDTAASALETMEEPAPLMLPNPAFDSNIASN